VVFYGRGEPFTRDPALGRAIRSLAHQYAATQQIYVAGEHIGPGPGHQVFLRLFWVDAERRDYFAILASSSIRRSSGPGCSTQRPAHASRRF
jgi:hypothetical protein